MTKNVDIDKYIYSGNGIGSDRIGTFSFGNGFGRNCIIFGVDMSSSVHVDNKEKDILILGEEPTQGLADIPPPPLINSSDIFLPGHSYSNLQPQPPWY